MIKRHRYPIRKMYLSGTSTKKGWRERLVPGLQVSSPIAVNVPVRFQDYLYVGPFFPDYDKKALEDIDKLANGGIYRYCEEGIAACDVLLAWIDEPECNIPLIEIAYAVALRKKIIVAFAPNITVFMRENHWCWFWFANFHFQSDVCEKDLPALLDEL